MNDKPGERARTDRSPTQQPSPAAASAAGPAWGGARKRPFMTIIGGSRTSMLPRAQSVSAPDDDPTMSGATIGSNSMGDDRYGASNRSTHSSFAPRSSRFYRKSVFDFSWHSLRFAVHKIVWIGKLSLCVQGAAVSAERAEPT